MMKRILLLLLFILCTLSIIQCDITNLNEFLGFIQTNSSVVHPVGFLSQANHDTIKGYLPKNINSVFFPNKSDMLEAIQNETIVAGITTGRLSQDLEPNYHVFSSLIISPQAMLLAPDYNNVSAPHGLKNQSSNDLFDALNAAIVAIQIEDTEETLLSKNKRTDLVRVYTCHQKELLPIKNRNNTSGYLNDILLNRKNISIGGLGPKNWGKHDGNYIDKQPSGFYPELLEAIVQKLGKLKGPDGITYNEHLSFERKFYNTTGLLFRALLKGEIHATDVYLLINTPYAGTGESCSNDSQCLPQESCKNDSCAHPARPRSLHFRTTCTTASRDTRFITKKGRSFYSKESRSMDNQTDNTRRKSGARWSAFLLLFVTLFGAIFLGLLIFVRRKQYYRNERTVQGGFGKFARLQEESEPPIEGMDVSGAHIVESAIGNI